MSHAQSAALRVLFGAAQDSGKPASHWSKPRLLGFYSKNRDLGVPFWSTKDAGQKPFTFTIGLGQGEISFD